MLKQELESVTGNTDAAKKSGQPPTPGYTAARMPCYNNNYKKGYDNICLFSLWFVHKELEASEKCQPAS